MNRKRFGIIFGVLVAVALIIGLSVGLCCKDPEEVPTPPPTTTSTTTTTTTTSSTTTTTTTTTTTSTLVPTAPPNVIAWGEWSAYSSCTVTCGDGQRSRLRFCSDGQGGIDQNAEGCEGDASEVISCNEGQCLSGLTLVIDVAKDLREKIDLKDNLFLDRYAQSVTENGETINAVDSVAAGYGVWRLTEDDFVRILSFSREQNSRSSTITNNLFSNIKNGCGSIENLTDSIELTELLDIVNAEPCVSAMSLVTLLQINGKYPVTVNLDAQEKLLSDISDQIVIDFQEGFTKIEMTL